MNSKATWHTKEIKDILAILKANSSGYSSDQANKLLAKFGPNSLPRGKTRGLPLIFLDQFKSPLIYILILAGATVFALGETIDGLSIAFVLVLNAIIGTIQEGKAGNTLEALRNFVHAEALVLRDGHEQELDEALLVPGDIIILREGAKIPADCRLLEASDLKIDEATLTGESVPVHKQTEVLGNEQLQIGDRHNMVWKGTNIVSGEGRAIVVETGIHTQVGQVAKQIEQNQAEIPLKVHIRHLSNGIIIIVAIIVTAIFLLGWYRGLDLLEVFSVAVSMAVSIIPEGLPIVITLVLATGVWRMAGRNALVKKLQAVEALGQATVIAVDKTGTITKNELVIRKVYIANTMYDVGGSGYESEGTISLKGQELESANHPELMQAGKLATYCASAHVSQDQVTSLWKVSGDPTEAAMLVLGNKLGFDKDLLTSENPKVDQIPFSYQTKYHATVHKESAGRYLLTVIGAPEIILNLSRPKSKAELTEAEAVLETLLGEGLRVVAIATKNLRKASVTHEDVAGLGFVGYFAMQDTLRDGVALSVAQARKAGIRTVMITGDHMITARAIASQAGIWHEGDSVLTGEMIEHMSEVEFSNALISATVFARVTPEHKTAIVRAYKARGETIAMTGDGVNDAPSLAAADLGLAMGKIGTEVAKEAADIVLLDDNFESIVSAVEEGRSIYKTIKKVILYLFSTSLGEVLTIGGALAIGLPLPLIAVQIIWLNLVTDGFLDVSLAMDPKEEGLLDQKPSPSGALFNYKMLGRMIIMALPMAVGTLLIFRHYMLIDIVKAQAMALTLLAAFQWANAWNCRSDIKSIFHNPWSNKYLVGATIVVISLQVLAIYNPTMQSLLHTTALSMTDWLIILAIAPSVIILEEARKYISRYFNLNAKRA